MSASFLHIKHRGEEEPLRCGQVQSTLISIPQCFYSERELSQLCHWQPSYATWPWQTYRHPLLNGASEKVWSLFSYEVNFGVSAMLKGNCKTRPDLTEYVPRLNFRVKEKVFSIGGWIPNLVFPFKTFALTSYDVAIYTHFPKLQQHPTNSLFFLHLPVFLKKFP